MNQHKLNIVYSGVEYFDDDSPLLYSWLLVEPKHVKRAQKLIDPEFKPFWPWDDFKEYGAIELLYEPDKALEFNVRVSSELSSHHAAFLLTGLDGHETFLDALVRLSWGLRMVCHVELIETPEVYKTVKRLENEDRSIRY